MTIATQLARELTNNEVAALSRYGADSRYIHAVSQGRSTDFQCDPIFRQFSNRCRNEVDALDAAIGVSVLTHDTTLYSAHGNGTAVRGNLSGKPSLFVGLEYCYPGFISTSSELEFSYRFLEKRRTTASNPTLLELRLPNGFSAIDMRHGNHHGEFEFLLGRNLRFEIIEARLEDIDVLYLTLTPLAPSPRGAEVSPKS